MHVRYIACYLTCMLTAVSHQEGGNCQRIWLGVLSRDGHTPHSIDAEELVCMRFGSDPVSRSCLLVERAAAMAVLDRLLFTEIVGMVPKHYRTADTKN